MGCHVYYFVMVFRKSNKKMRDILKYSKIYLLNPIIFCIFVRYMLIDCVNMIKKRRILKCKRE